MDNLATFAAIARRTLKIVLPETIVGPIGELFNYLTGRRDLWEKYCRYKNLGRFRNEFARQARAKTQIVSNDALFWNMYIQTLIETGNHSAAKSIFEKYQRAIPSIPLTNRFLRVADFICDKMLLNNDQLSVSSRLCKAILKNHNSNAFFELVKGKTVAVVGNGPSEIGTGNGNEIDAHDIVIRFNNYDTSRNYSLDYGKKTSIRAKCLGAIVRHDNCDTGISMTLYADDLSRIPLDNDDYIESLQYDNTHNITIDYVDIATRSQYTESMKIFPTTGLLVIDLLSKSSAKSVDAYGFSFLVGDTPPVNYEHYNNDIPTKELTGGTKKLHSIDKEYNILKEMFTGRRLKISHS